MDRARFDALSRLIATSRSRREALSAILGAAFLGQTVDALAKPGGKRRGRGQGQRRRTRAQASPPGSCFGSGSCNPGQGANLQKCDFTDSTVLNGVNCKLCNVQDSSLLRAKAIGTNFTKANLARVCFVDADLTGANLSQANLSGAIFCRTKMPNGSINNSGCSKPTKCCQTCIEVGAACNGVGGACCGEAVCQGNTCCTPESDEAACAAAGAQCGIVLNNCRQNVTCGPCDPVECRSIVCQANQCVDEGGVPDLTPCSDGLCCLGACVLGANCCDDADCTGSSNLCPISTGDQVCVCGGGDSPCSGSTPDCCGTGFAAVCTNTDNDPDNCGACGNDCGVEVCINGNCEE